MIQRRWCSCRSKQVMALEDDICISGLQHQLLKPFDRNPKASVLNRTYLYHGTGFHSAAMGWGWDPPKSWEAVTAEEVVTLTSQLKGVGREAEAVALLQKVLAGGNGTTGGARALVVESESARQRYTGTDGYLSEELDVCTRVGGRNGSGAADSVHLRFSSVWLSRAIVPRDRRASRGNDSPILLLAANNSRGRSSSNFDEDPQVLEVLQGTVEMRVACRAGESKEAKEEEGTGKEEGGAWRWVPVLSYAQQGPSSAGLWLFMADLTAAEQGWPTMLLASCVGQHRREGSKAEPRYRLRELMLQAMLQQQKGSNGGGPVCLMGGGVRGEEEGKRLQLEVGCEVEAWRAHLRGLETALRQDDHHPVGSSSSSTRARAPHNAAAADTKGKDKRQAEEGWYERQAELVGGGDFFNDMADMED